MRRFFHTILTVLLLTACSAFDAFSQTVPVLDGPLPPIAPEVISRDEGGKVTVRAIKLTAPLVLDGKLDEEVYAQEHSFGGFLQVAPKYGAPETERTEVWVMYDTEYIYVTCRCWDSAPPDQWIANELRRDTNQLRQNDHIGVSFDTFYDRRNAFLFYTNPLGARADYSVVDEGAPNTDWNPVWESRTGRFDGGWTSRWRFRSSRCATVGAGSDLGHPDAAVRAAQERVDLPDAGAADPGRAAGVQPDLLGRHAGRPRSAGGGEEPRAQAVRDFAA